MENKEDKKIHIFKYFKIGLINENFNKYEDYFNLRKNAIHDLVMAHLNIKQEFQIDENKIGIIEKIEVTDKYFLGKFSNMHDKNCNYIEHRSYNNFDLVEEKDVGTSCFAYFYIDFEKNIIIYLNRSEISGFTFCLNKALRKTVNIKVLALDNWKEEFIKKFVNIKTIQLRYLDENKNNEFINSIDKMGDIKDFLIYDTLNLKVKKDNEKYIITKITEVNVDAFDEFSLKVIDKKGKVHSFDLIEKVIQKKEELLLNPIDLSEKAPINKIVEIFKKIC